MSSSDFRYHISPKDGQPRVCKAKKQCPIGGDHFATRSDALKHIEEEAAKLEPAIPAGMKKEIQYISHTQREASVRALSMTMYSRAISYQPGCSGCSDDFGDGYGDYCRCTTYDGTFERVEPSVLAFALRTDLEENLDPGLSELSDLVWKHQLHDESCYHPEAISDYYGEELRGVSLTSLGNERLNALLEDLRLTTVKPAK